MADGAVVVRHDGETLLEERPALLPDRRDSNAGTASDGEADVAARLHATVGLSGPLAPDEAAVRRPIRKVRLDPVPKTVARCEHHGEHEDAPEHAECGQESPHLVAAQRLPDLAPMVSID